MSSIILTNWTVYYQADAGTAGQGSKQIKWTGGSTGTNTVNQLYSALMHLFDNASQNDAEDSVPIKAITPTLYEIGTFDAGDRRPWFIDPTSVKHLTGAGIDSSHWTRDTTARVASHGIYKITRSGTNIVIGDVGATITNGTRSGWLLHVDGSYLYIRPTDGTSTHDWSVTSGTITCNSHSDTQTGYATAESIWSNIYTLGSLEANTEIYVYQNFAQLTSWWSTGHIDALILTTDFGTLIDSGLLTIYARQYSKLYDHYTTDVSDGGRTPIPIATAADSNNPSGYWTFTGTGASSALFNLGNYIYVGTNWSSATKKGVLTAVSSSTLTYYLIGDLTNIQNGDAVKEYIPSTQVDGDGNCTAGTPAAAGPTTSPSSTLTVSFGGSSHDLNNGHGSAPYSVTLDLLDTISIEELYERLKYLTRRGQITDIDTETTQSLIGQEYTAIGDYYIPYDTGSVDNPFTEGETITAAGSFSCVLTSKHDRGASEGFLIVRNVRGTLPVDNTTLTGSTSTHTALVDTNAGADPVTQITQAKVSPFGTFAGGKFFGARGVWLANVPAADANNYELIDSLGIRQAPPNTIAITINGVNSGDKVSVFRTTGNNEIIDREIYTSTATGNNLGDGDFVVQETIDTDTPASGYLRVVNNTINDEDIYAYSSWSGSTFTLDGVTLVDTYTAADTAYVPYIQTTATGSSVSQAVTYAADRYVLVVVRAAGTIPFKVAGQVTSSGLTVTAIRTTDSIYQ